MESLPSRGAITGAAAGPSRVKVVILCGGGVAGPAFMVVSKCVEVGWQNLSRGVFVLRFTSTHSLYFSLYFLYF